MSTAAQQTVDAYLHRWTNADDEVTGESAARIAHAVSDLFGLEVYCTAHHTNHHIGAIEIERLIATLHVSFADSVTSDEEPDDILDRCLLDFIADSKDSEVYLEHVDGMIDARRNA